MSSSEDRRAPSRERSSSKEQETNKTGDNAAQAGLPSISAADRRAHYLRRVAVYEQEDRMAKAGLAATLVTSSNITGPLVHSAAPQPIDSLELVNDYHPDAETKLLIAEFLKVKGKQELLAVLRQGLRKGKAPSDEAEEATAAPAVAPEGSQSASASVVHQDPVLSSPSQIHWSDLRSPREPFFCIIQFNNSRRIGSFAKHRKNWTFQLGIDVGYDEEASLTLKFFSEGTEGPQTAETSWGLAEGKPGSWRVTDFKIYCVADCAEGGEICSPYVLSACRIDEERRRLVCISLEAWPKIVGPFSKSDPSTSPLPGIEDHFSTVRNGPLPYKLRIWFRAPYNVDRFNQQCLAFLSLVFQRRGISLAGSLGSGEASTQKRKGTDTVST